MDVKYLHIFRSVATPGSTRHVLKQKFGILKNMALKGVFRQPLPTPRPQPIPLQGNYTMDSLGVSTTHTAFFDHYV